MAHSKRIETSPHVMMGKPVVRGTRIAVELILHKLNEGANEAALLKAYPRLKREDLQAVAKYAADSLKNEKTIILNPKKKPSRK